MQWIWVGVNPGCTDTYAVLEWANDMKFGSFATKHKPNTYHEHLIQFDDSWPPVKFMTLHETQEYFVPLSAEFQNIYYNQHHNVYTSHNIWGRSHETG